MTNDTLHTATFSIENRQYGTRIEFRCRLDADDAITGFEEIEGDRVSNPVPPEGITAARFLLERVASRGGEQDDLTNAAGFVSSLAVRKAMLARFDALVSRLVAKMKLSQTPVPGFMVGLSGTDSILSFLVVAAAAERMKMNSRVVGIHYVNAKRRKPTWFEQYAIPWLAKMAPAATIIVAEPLGGNHDQQRWADLHLRALNSITIRENGDPVVQALPPGQNYWVVGCTNATEQDLGKYSTMSREVSVAPIRTLRKSKVLDMCLALDVPSIAIEYAQLPDCLCGRDEIAARNIRLIDAILDHDVRVREHDPDLLDSMFAYVRELKKDNGFKQRTPYLV